MAAKTLYLFSLLAQVLLPFSFALVCNEGPPGIFCSDDMMGFHNCTWVNGQYANRFVQCPEQTRCSCFLERDCGKQEREDPCQVYYPAELDSVYTMRLKSQKKIVHPMGSSIRDVSSTWSFDKNNQMSMKRDSYGNFKLVLSNGQSFDVYEGIDGSYCRKSITSKLYNPINLDLYRFIGPETIKSLGKEVVTQKWKYAKGRRHPGQQLKEKTWWFTSEMRPVKLSKKVLGTAYSRTNEYFDFEVSDYIPSVSKDAFNIPDVCRNV